MALTTRSSTIWTDASGGTRQTLLNGSATLVPVRNQLIAVSNADYTLYLEGAPVVNGAPTTLAAPFPSVADYAVLIFQAATGEMVYVTLPAPQSGIFMADGETVNSAAIGGLIAAILGAVVTASGAALTTFVGGVRRARLREYQ